MHQTFENSLDFMNDSAKQTLLRILKLPVELSFVDFGGTGMAVVPTAAVALSGDIFADADVTPLSKVDVLEMRSALGDDVQPTNTNLASFNLAITDSFALYKQGDRKAAKKALKQARKLL